MNSTEAMQTDLVSQRIARHVSDRQGLEASNAVLFYLRNIFSRLDTIEKKLGLNGPKPKGFES
jgi:hypothetical protein